MNAKLSGRTEGLTIIEVLVVVAIIGILSVLVLSGVGISRKKASDGRIRSDIRQIRVLAETSYNEQGASYVDWSQHASIQSELTVLKADVDEQTGVPDSTIIRESQEKEFCISAPLKAADGHFCTDVTGTIRLAPSGCPDHPIDGPPLRCPEL